MLAFQAFFNIAVTIGIMPITGITLPLISYGGSSTVATCILLGLLRNVDRHRAHPAYSTPPASLSPTH